MLFKIASRTLNITNLCAILMCKIQRGKKRKPKEMNRYRVSFGRWDFCRYQFFPKWYRLNAILTC